MSVESVKYGDICDKCAHAEYCDMATFGGHNPKITACSKFTERHQSNADRIRAMTDEELAMWIYQVQDECALRKGNFMSPLSQVWWLNWLKQETRVKI